MTEQELKALKRKATWLTIWKITKVVMFPLVVVVGAVMAVIFGAVLAIAGESLKRISK